MRNDVKVGANRRSLAEILQILLRDGGTNTNRRGRELTLRSLAVGYGLNDLGRRGLKPTLRELDATWMTETTDEFFLNVNS